MCRRKALNRAPAPAAHRVTATLFPRPAFAASRRRSHRRTETEAARDRREVSGQPSPGPLLRHRVALGACCPASCGIGTSRGSSRRRGDDGRPFLTGVREDRTHGSPCSCSSKTRGRWAQPAPAATLRGAAASGRLARSSRRPGKPRPAATGVWFITSAMRTRSARLLAPILRMAAPR